MKVVFDTNIVLDLLLDRQPWAQPAAELFARVESGALEGYLCATTLTTVHYLAAKSVGAERARKEVRDLLSLFAVAPVNRPILLAATELSFADFEDAVLYEAARHVAAEVIVTRDPAGFKKAELPIVAPEEFAKVLKQREP